MEIFLSILLGLGLLFGCFFIAFEMEKNKYRKEYENKLKEKEEVEKFYNMTPQERQEFIEKYASKEYMNTKITYGLPYKCPKCNQDTKWKAVDSQKKQEFDSAITIGSYTQVNVKETEIVRFICPKCGFELTKSH